MTSVVLILSMLPVAMQIAENAETRASLGAVLVGGMATSTLLSLLYVPVAYTYFDSFEQLLGRLFRWRPRLPFRRAPATGMSPAAPTRLPLPIAGGALLEGELVRIEHRPAWRARRRRNNHLAPHHHHGGGARRDDRSP